MKRRSCASSGRPRQAGCFWRVRNGPEVALHVDDRLHGVRSERADQLVLEIGLADVEAEPFEVRASLGGAEAGTLEAAPELALLAGVAEPG